MIENHQKHREVIRYTVKKSDHFTRIRAKQIKEIKKSITVMQFIKDSNCLIIGAYDPNIYIYDYTSSTVIKSIPSSRNGTFSLLEIQKNSNESFIAAGGDKSVIIYSLPEFKEVCSVIHHNSWVTSFLYIKNKGYLLSASWDKTIVVWENVFDHLSFKMAIEIPASVKSLLLLKPEEEVFVYGGENKLIVNSAEYFTKLGTIPYRYSHFSSMQQISHNEIICNSWCGILVVFDIINYQMIKEMEIWQNLPVYSFCLIGYNEIIVGGMYGMLMKYNMNKGQKCLKCFLENKEGKIYQIMKLPNQNGFIASENNNIIYELN